MRFLIYLIICFCISSDPAFAVGKAVKTKPALTPQRKRTLTLEEKKKEIIENPDPAIYNDIFSSDSDDNGNGDDEGEETPAPDKQSRFKSDISSMGSSIKGIMKNHNFELSGVPYSLQGLPILYTSKSTGFNYGLRMSFANMKFEQPYIYKLAFQYWASDRGVQNHEVELDIPIFFSRKWHMRFDYKYETVIDQSFFGIGNNSVFNPNFVDPRNPAFISRTYYQYNLHYPSFTFDLEYKFFSEIFSVYAGIGVEKATITPLRYDSTSYIYNQKPYGYKGGKTNYIKAGFMFDTRDYPFNPTKGITIAATYTSHSKFIGSDYLYKSVDLSYMGFYSFLKYFTIGHRIMVDQLWGDLPFFALAEFKSYRSYEGLGGGEILRGAPSFRFIDNLKFINQLELRTRFYNGMVFGQHLQVNVNPFWDFGRVWDRRKRITFDGFHNTFGSELRFTWNANFIASFTFGISKDASSTYLSFGESFK